MGYLVTTLNEVPIIIILIREQHSFLSLEYRHKKYSAKFSANLLSNTIDSPSLLAYVNFNIAYIITHLKNISCSKLDCCSRTIHNDEYNTIHYNTIREQHKVRGIICV